MNDAKPAPENRSQAASPLRRQLLILFMISGAVLLFVAVAILVYLGLRGTPPPREETPTPTESVVVTPTVTATPGPTPSCQTILSSGDVEISMALPYSLSIEGTTYPVEPFVPREQAWGYPADRSGQAVWVCGTVVNYVIALEPSPGNEEVIAALASGDEVRLSFANGVVLLFRVVAQEEASPGDRAALGQQQPRLTLVLPRSDTWQIAIADYAAEAEAMELPSGGVPVEPGEAVEVGQVRITVERGEMVRMDELSQGTAYYLVEVSAENVGSDPIRVDAFTMQLRDGLGNAYPLSAQASAVGESGPLNGEIEPGVSVRGTAGYLVPDPLPPGDLTWLFSPPSGTEAALVRIPHPGEVVEENLDVEPDVIVTDAFLNRDGTVLVIEGEVENRSTQTLVVEAEDINLSSSAGPGELIMEAPPLPWGIEPGQRQVVELQYERPDASTVLLELLGYSFEIDGLQ